jgi:hypothetical protein
MLIPPGLDQLPDTTSFEEGILWLFHVAGNNKSHLVYAKRQVILPAFKQIWSLSTSVHRSDQTSNFTDIGTAGDWPTHALTRTDMTQLEGAFRNRTFAPNKQIIYHAGHNTHVILNIPVTSIKCYLMEKKTHGMTLVDFQLDAQNSYLFTYIHTFIKILYLYPAHLQEVYVVISTIFNVINILYYFNNQINLAII